MKSLGPLLLSALLVAGCQSIAGYEPVAASIAEADTGPALDGGASSEPGPADDAKIVGDHSLDKGAADGLVSPPDATADGGSVSSDATLDAEEDAEEDAQADAPDDGTVDGPIVSPDATVDSPLPVSDFALACFDARTQLDLYLFSYRVCAVVTECAFAYVPPCGCTTFLNADPKDLKDLNAYERAVMNACYPAPFGCPQRECGTAQAKCINNTQCGASYTL